MVNLPLRDPRFTNGISVLKRADNPSKTMNTLGDRLHGTRKMLRWCLKVFEKIVAKHLKNSLRLHTSGIRRLREFVSLNGLTYGRETLGSRFVSSAEVKGTSQEALREVGKKWLPAVLPEVIRTKAEVYCRPRGLLRIWMCSGAVNLFVPVPYSG
ncbi:hypothetical protein TNCV_4751561 [Trichonephila clavipes]|nr:hypothetical protein TNCV_4751561 [Trichonephila clavipes]